MIKGGSAGGTPRASTGGRLERTTAAAICQPFGASRRMTFDAVERHSIFT